MEGVTGFLWVHRIFPSQKQWCHKHPLFTGIILTIKTLGGDEIRRQSPKFVTLRKKEFFNPGNAQGQTGFDQCLGHCCTDFNTRKNNRVTLRKFSPKSMTKLEALTVCKFFVLVCLSILLARDKSSLVLTQNTVLKLRTVLFRNVLHILKIFQGI
jgi:hypothetical protein